MIVRYLFITSAVAFYLLLLLTVAGRQMEWNKYKIVLLTVESLRYDMVTPENTPHLLNAARHATRFVNYRAVSGWTGTNIVSLLTGLTPFESGVHTRGQSVAPNLQLPLKQLKNQGYTVVGLQPFMTMGLYKNLGLDVAKTNHDPLLWLGNQKKANAPFFLWYHYVHTHLPYTQASTRQSSSPDIGHSSEYSAQLAKISTQASIHFDEAFYTREDTLRIRDLQKHNLQEFDQWFGDFWSFFLKGGFRRDTILVVTADHGDEHGERGMVGHASTTLAGHLHEEIVRIPLFIWLPEKFTKAVGSSRETTASHVDIMVTLVDLLDMQPSISLHGRNIFTAEDSGEWSAMTSSGGFAEPDPKKIRWFEYAFLHGSWKSRWRLYANGREEFFLFNLAEDAAELHDLATQEQDIAAFHRSSLQPLIDQSVLRPVAIEEKPGKQNDDCPNWITPAASGTYSFNSLNGNFLLQWTGSSEKKYILEYQAGRVPKMITGTLEINGNTKVFNNIDRRYWDTWIVPQSPFRLRIKEVGGSWSDWVTIETIQ